MTGLTCTFGLSNIAYVEGRDNPQEVVGGKAFYEEYLTLTISRTITCKLNYHIKEFIHPLRINAFIGILYKMEIFFFSNATVS